MNSGKPSVITAAQFVEEVRKLKGVPWRHQGRTRFGVDCIGLVILACNNGGLDLTEYMGLSLPPSYSRNPNPNSVSILSKHCTQVSRPITGCVLLFRFPDEKLPRHFGVFTGETIIHAEARSRRVVEHGYHSQWSKWTHSMWLVPGVDYSDVSKLA